MFNTWGIAEPEEIFLFSRFLFEVTAQETRGRNKRLIEEQLLQAKDNSFTFLLKDLSYMPLLFCFRLFDLNVVPILYGRENYLNIVVFLVATAYLK